MHVCVFVSPCVAVSLHHTHPSLPPFATWPVNYLFLFTHAHKENKPLSDCLDRLHSPSPPPLFPTSLSLFLSAVDPWQHLLSQPRIRQAFISFGRGHTVGRSSLGFSNCQRDVSVGHLVVNDHHFNSNLYLHN